MSEVLLLFEVGGRRFATAADRVARVANVGDAALQFRDDTSLGRAAAPTRALVIEGGAALAVDAVRGMAAGIAVHALPAFAAACMTGRGIAGLIEYGDELLPLVDLPALFHPLRAPNRDTARRTHPAI